VANIINYSYVLFGQTFDLLSVLVGMALTIILFYGLKSTRSIFKKKRQANELDLMLKKIEVADQCLRNMHNIQNEQYAFISDLNKRVKGG